MTIQEVQNNANMSCVSKFGFFLECALAVSVLYAACYWMMLKRTTKFQLEYAYIWDMEMYFTLCARGVKLPHTLLIFSEQQLSVFVQNFLYWDLSFKNMAYFLCITTVKFILLYILLCVTNKIWFDLNWHSQLWCNVYTAHWLCYCYHSNKYLE